MADFLSVNGLAFEQNGLSHLLNGNTEAKLEGLCRIMQTKNEQMNVTAITDDDGIARKHFCDCAFLSELIPEGADVIDVGCGGGFPCLPLAIFRDDVHITAIDSTAKKVNYVADTARELELCNVKCISMRAEDGANDEKYREKYDAATARAVASLDILCELCLPYVKVGGRFFAMKGRGAQEELAAAENAIKTLGGRLCRVCEFPLNVGDEIQHRYIIEIEKISQTPKAYPRAYGRIKKKPL